MEYQELMDFMKNSGADPSRLIFEDELTGIRNRRYMGNYFLHKVDWNKLDKKPVSLVMLDLDFFKAVNDSYGHDAGDTVLIYIADLLKAVAGRTGIPIRYAGDEFMILLPGQSKKEAMIVGNTLLDKVRKSSCAIEDNSDSLDITLSIGVASAPQDAGDSRELVKKVDLALYHAKKNGRDRLADAREADPDMIAARTALQALGKGAIAGGKVQLSLAVEKLNAFFRGKNQFIVATGRPGFGKSTFLKLVERHLAGKNISWAHVKGVSQELFRPYYLAAELVMVLLNQQPDKGTLALKRLSDEDRSNLALVLPKLVSTGSTTPMDGAKSREDIFNTLASFIPKLLGYSPLVLFVDDMHMADEASLLLLRILIKRSEIPVFICGAADEGGLRTSGDPLPLGRFCLNYENDIDIIKISLTALSTGDVKSLLGQLFPGAEIPENFGAGLSKVSQGNPLFLKEIFQKLITDNKVLIKKGEWQILPLAKDYLPNSLEEIISQKVAKLDNDEKELLDRVSTFGTVVPLSMLAGSSEKMEARVLDFIDTAAAQGLVSTEFMENDENVKFLGSRVAEIVYGNIASSTKERLHENIGDYQESLIEKGVAPSAAILAYHYQRSTNLKKANTYELLQARHSNMVFNSNEASEYSGEQVDQDTPLDSLSLERVPVFIRFLLIAVRNIRLYPKGSKLIRDSVVKLKKILDSILETNSCLHLAIERKTLTVNGEKLKIQAFKNTATVLYKFMHSMELGSIIFRKGIDEVSLTRFFDNFGHVDRKTIQDGFWVRFNTDNDLAHVELRQVRYKEMMDKKPVISHRDDNPVGMAAHDMPRDNDLDEGDFKIAASVTKALINAASKIRLYPPDGPVAGVAIDQVMETMGDFFKSRSMISFSGVGSRLFVNGTRTETSDFGKTAPILLALLKKLGLKSLAFLPGASKDDFVAFFTIMNKMPKAGAKGKLWQKAATSHGVSGILFDQTVYGIMEGGPIKLDGQKEVPDGEEEVHGKKEVHGEEALSFLVMAQNVRDHFLKGEEEKSAGIIQKMFDHSTGNNYEKKAEELIKALAGMLESPDLASQPVFIKMVADPLVEVFSGEETPGVFEPMARLLFETAVNLIRLGEYSLASWIWGCLSRRKKEIQTHESGDSRPLLQSLSMDLDPGIRKLLVADIVYGDRTRQQMAVQLLGSLGQDTVYMFVDIIKDNDDLRIRQIAAKWLARVGPSAVEQLKEELHECTDFKQCVRILEVIDTITTDVINELTLTMGDSNSKIRKAAFSLAERIKGPGVIRILMKYAQDEDKGLSETAVNSLGKIRALASTDMLVEMAGSAKSPELLVASCRALGRIGDSAATSVLCAILQPKRWRFWKKMPSRQVRFAAVMALSQIDDKNAAATLALLVSDPDPRIRDIIKRMGIL